MAIPIDIQVESDKDLILENEKMFLTIMATVNSKRIKNVDINIELLNGGSLTETSGATDDNGVFTTIFTPEDIDTQTTYQLRIIASKQYLETSYLDYDIVVTNIQESDKRKLNEFSVMLYTIRGKILRALELELQDDEDLYPSTGGVDNPYFLNGWNLSFREFPQVIVSGASMNIEKKYIGDHASSDVIATVPNYGTYGQPYPGTAEKKHFSNRSGWYSLSLNLNVLTESETSKEIIADKCFDTLWTRRNMWLLSQNVLITDMSVSNETTEPYGNNFLYGINISLNVLTEWFKQSEYKRKIEKLIITSTTN